VSACPSFKKGRIEGERRPSQQNGGVCVGADNGKNLLAIFVRIGGGGGREGEGGKEDPLLMIARQEALVEKKGESTPPFSCH